MLEVCHFKIHLHVSAILSNWYYHLYCKLKVNVGSGQMAQWVGPLSHTGIVEGLIPGQNTYRGYEFDPQPGYIWETTH